MLETPMKNMYVERFLMLSSFRYDTKLTQVGDKLAQGGLKLTASRTHRRYRELVFYSYTCKLRDRQYRSQLPLSRGAEVQSGSAESKSGLAEVKSGFAEVKRESKLSRSEP